MNSTAALLLTTLVCALALTSSHSIKKRGVTLIPTLTVDVAPTFNQLPVPFNTGMMEYHFPVGKMFNLSCVIKHPSFRYHMSIRRRAIFNNGTKGEDAGLVAPNSYDPHPSFERDRLTTDTDEYFGTYDPTARYFRVSVIIRKLQIDDTGIYSCDYHDITKEIKVVVFKQALSNDIEFPVENIKKVRLNKPIDIGCRVKDVYPAPIVSFVLPDGKTVTKVNKTDQSIKNKTIYYYTEMSEMHLVPKYTDHNKNLTCSVFTIGSSNLTVDKTLLLNVDGFQLTEKCSTFFTGGVDETDVEYSCTYFANPKVVPEWTTEERALKEVIDGAKKIATNSLDSANVNDKLPKVTVPTGVSQIATVAAENLVKISSFESEKSNYVSSLEELGDGLYRATLRVKQITLSDYKAYKMVFSHSNKDTEHVVNLRKTGFKKLETLGGSSALSLSSSIVHSITAITFASLLIRLTR